MRLLLGLLLLFPPSLGHVADVSYELGESGYEEHKERGQRTCLEEAMGMEVSGVCPQETFGNYPKVGTLVLDSYLAYPLGMDFEVMSDPGFGESVLAREENARWMGTSPYRSGLPLPDLLLPGSARFMAWYGYWWNRNLDSVIDVDYPDGLNPGPLSEYFTSPWLPKLLGFVEPGSHPPFISRNSPQEYEPDFEYTYSPRFVWGVQGQVFYQSQVLFLDGSLLQHYEVLSVSNPILIPSEFFPFSPSDQSRIDVDEYATLAPEPIGAIYRATMAPVVVGLGSPRLGWCGRNCDLSPPDPTLPEGRGAMGPIYGRVWGAYPRELDPKSTSSSSGRGEEFRLSYHAWADLQIRWGPDTAAPILRPGPLPGRSIEGEPASPPGVLVLEVFTGVFRDLDGNGAVGETAGEDPYRSGVSPIPDDYDSPGREFLGAWNDSSAFGRRMFVTLVPDSTWGPLGVTDWGVCLLQVCGTKIPDLPVDRVGTGKVLGRGRYAVGSDPLRVELLQDLPSASNSGRTGHWRGALYIPDGTLHGGFTACVGFDPIRGVEEDLTILFREGGIDLRERAWDCDHVGKWEAGPLG